MMGRAGTRNHSGRAGYAGQRRAGGNASQVDQPPVFADPSGRRRRRRAGICCAAVLIGCLAIVIVALLGGPTAPFIPWAAAGPPAPAPSALARGATAGPGAAVAGPSQPR